MVGGPQSHPLGKHYTLRAVSHLPRGSVAPLRPSARPTLSHPPAKEEVAGERDGGDAPAEHVQHRALVKGAH